MRDAGHAGQPVRGGGRLGKRRLPPTWQKASLGVRYFAAVPPGVRFFFSTTSWLSGARRLHLRGLHELHEVVPQGCRLHPLDPHGPVDAHAEYRRVLRDNPAPLQPPFPLPTGVPRTTLRSPTNAHSQTAPWSQRHPQPQPQPHPTGCTCSPTCHAEPDSRADCTSALERAHSQRAARVVDSSGSMAVVN